MKTFIDGLSTGFFLQLALGPVFFLILNITLNTGLLNGVAATLGVTLIDFVYISLSFLGIGKLLEKKSARFLLGIISSIVLILFGIVMVYSGMFTETAAPKSSILTDSKWTCFFAGILLTVSSPLTIVFWSSVFTAKAIDRNYSRGALALFGLGAGSATPLFLVCSMSLVSIFHKHIPEAAVRILNLGVGFLLIVYGILRFGKTLRQRKNSLKIEPNSPELK